MRIYFFDLVFSNSSILDTEGSELPDLRTATAEARQIVLELAIDYLRERQVFDLVSVCICSEQNALLGEVFPADVLTDLIPAYLFTCSTPDLPFIEA